MSSLGLSFAAAFMLPYRTVTIRVLDRPCMYVYDLLKFVKFQNSM